MPMQIIVTGAKQGYYSEFKTDRFFIFTKIQHAGVKLKS